MTILNSDEVLGKHLSVYGTLRLTSEMKGRKVKTENGLAEIVRVITNQQLLHIRYPDRTVGWVRVGRFEFID